MTPARPSAQIRAFTTIPAALACGAILAGCASGSGAGAVVLPDPVDASASATPAPSITSAVIPLEYIAYSNTRFSFSIDRPRSFVVDGGVQEGDGQVFATSDGTGSLSVWGVLNEAGYVPGTYLASLKSEQYGGVVTYEEVDGAVVTVSGYTPEDKIFYVRAVVTPETIQVLRWEYPRAHKEAYDALVDRSVESFQPGEPIF